LRFTDFAQKLGRAGCNNESTRSYMVADRALCNMLSSSNEFAEAVEAVEAVETDDRAAM